MCGIVGLYRWGHAGVPVGVRLKEMCDAIVHRGPDDEGFYTDDEIGLGMRRLSIIDVDGGHQPIENEDGSVVVVFNGEIYNYRSLRDDLARRGHVFRSQADTEVIVHAYEEEGLDCVDALNGIFAFAVWDARAHRLVMARDRMGVKPLYYYRTPEGLAFGSEIKALLALREVPRELDLEAVGQFFRLGFVPAPRTLFQGVSRLPAGCQLVAEREGIRLRQYWDLEFEEDQRARSFPEYAEELRTLLQEVVADQMVSDVPLGAFLSGGVDSSGIVAMMRRTTGVVRTYTIGFGREHTYHNEAPYAEAVANQLGTVHRMLVVGPKVVELLPALVEKLDEPLTDTSFLVTYLISELARREVKVALSGVGGDELFAGYRRYLASPVSDIIGRVPSSLR